MIRSWLLDLLVAALDEDPGLSKIRGYAEDSGEGRWTVEAGIEHAVATPAITAALYARFVSRQDDSPAMKAVAAMRNQFGGHAVHTGGAAPAGDATATPRRSAYPRRARRPPDPARLPLVRRRRRRARSRASRRSSAATARARPTWSRRSTTSSRLASHRVASDAPLVRAGAEQALVRAAVVRDGRTAMLEVELNPGRSNRARINRRPLPRARELLGLVRTVIFSPGGPGPGQGRPVRPAPVPRRPAGAAHAAAGRGARRLRPDPQAAQLPAQDRRRGRGAGRPRRSRRWPPSRSGTSTWPAPAASCSPSGWRWSTSCGRYVGKAYETVARGAVARRRRRWTTSPRSTCAGGPARGPATGWRSASAAGRARAPPQRRARPRHLAGRPAPRRPGAHPRQRRRPGCR